MLSARVRWFEALCHAEAANPHAIHHALTDQDSPPPERPLDQTTLEQLPQFLLPESFPFLDATQDRYLPLRSGFGAIPATLPLEHDEGRPVILGETLRKTLHTAPLGLHIASVGDLLWLLPQLITHLPLDARFYAPMHGSMRCQGEQDRCFLFARQVERQHTWRVIPYSDRLDLNVHERVPVILLTYQRPFEL